MDIYSSKKISDYWINDNSYYAMKDINKFTNYFFLWLPNSKLYIDKNNYKSHIKIYDIQEYDNINKDNINILLCVENCYYWKHYNHYNIYGNYGDENIDIYLYNHIDKFIETNKYIAIPIIYLQIDYYKNMNSILSIDKNLCVFYKKQFCLIVSNPKGSCKNDLEKIESYIKKIYPCHHISRYSHILGQESCYHSEKLLRIFNNYKFILCYENSFTNGYITEKIFNVFLAKSIPLYVGPTDVYRYFNKDCFFNLREINKTMNINIKSICNNEKLFNEMIQKPKINKYFTNENYAERSNKFLKKLLS
jgi:hypothetical protein